MKVDQALLQLITILEGASRLGATIIQARSAGRDDLTLEEVRQFADFDSTSRQKLLDAILSKGG